MHLGSFTSYVQWSTKVLGHFALFLFCNDLSFSSSLQIVLALGEVHAIMGKFHVHANFKCPIDKPTLLEGGGGACMLQR